MAEPTEEDEPDAAHVHRRREHDGLRHHHAADQHGAGRRDLAAVLDRDRGRLDGDRLRLRAGRHSSTSAPAAWRRTRRTRYGKDGYFQVFFLYFLSLAIGNVAIAISAVGYLATFFPWLSSTPIATCIGVIALLWLTTVANFGGPSVTGKIGSVTVWGVILPVGVLSLHRLVLVQQRHVRRGLESAGPEPRRGHGLEHRAHAVGLPRHGVGGAELGRGREPEARRAARLHVRHARRGRHLRPVDDRDPGHRAERGARGLDRSVRARLRADVQPDRRLHRHGARRHGLPRLAARLAVHDRADRQVGGRRAHVPGVLRQGEQRWARRSPA